MYAADLVRFSFDFSVETSNWETKDYERLLTECKQPTLFTLPLFVDSISSFISEIAQQIPCSQVLTFHSKTDLVGHVSDLPEGVGQVVVFFEEVEGAESQQLEGDAHVTVVVKPVEHLYAEAARQTEQRWLETLMQRQSHFIREQSGLLNCRNLQPELTICYRGPFR